MALAKLSISNIRNIVSEEFDPSPGLNLIYGNNGGGKSSILESIYLLGRGRSFRTRQIKQVVSLSTSRLLVVGCFFDESSAISDTIGFGYDKSSKTSIRVNGRNIKSSAELANHFPLLFIGSDTGRLLSAGERQRRRCLDWGVFHVEPLFISTWQRYSKALKQRNASLHRGSKELTEVWDIELSDAGEALTRFRQDYIEKLKPIFFAYADQLVSNSIEITKLSFEQGWLNTATSYLDYLRETYRKDIEMGYTQRGPHRADLKLDIEHGSLINFGSGGQQKLITCALLLSQVALYKNKTGKQCTILVDDLPAELDPLFRGQFMELLITLGSQLFITSTELGLIEVDNVADKKMFHVEQGKIVSVN